MNESDSVFLAELLRAEEQFAPDADQVRAAVASGVRRRRRSRSMLVGAAVVAVIAAMSVAAYLTLPATGNSSVVRSGAAPQKWQRTLRLGWLPDVLTGKNIQLGVAGESILMGAYGSGGLYLDVSVDRVAWQPNLALAGWQPIVVNGRDGRMVSRPTRTMLLWQLPSEHWAHLELGKGMPGGPNAQPGLEQDATRIAAGVSEGVATSVTSRLSLTYLPPGYRLTSMDYSEPGPTTVDSVEASAGSLQPSGTRTSGTEDNIVDEYPSSPDEGSVFVTLSQGDPLFADKINPATGYVKVGEVQGHPAYAMGSVDPVSGTKSALDARQIFVPEFQGGTLIVSGASSIHGPPVDQLLKIAEGVRWDP